MPTAFIARGKLYLLSDDGETEEIQSEFASKQEREADRRQTYSPWTKESEFRPFCSDRCKNRDFGAWANEEYRIANATPPDDASFEGARSSE